MRLIIAGSRQFYYPLNLELVEKAVQDSGWRDQITEIISGCARGIDDAAILFAEKNAIPLKKMKADWRMHSRKAGMVRNVEMAECADALIAVWDGSSKGTKHMIDTAKEKGLKVYVTISGKRRYGMFEFEGKND